MISSIAQNAAAIPTAEFAFLREEIRHEDNLISQRLSWLVGSQSFLLTAFAIALNGSIQSKLPGYERLNMALISLVPIVGVLVCLVSAFTIFASILHMRYVRSLAGTFHPEHLPDVQGRKLTRGLGLSGPICLPVAFLAVWVVLLIRQ